MPLQSGSNINTRLLSSVMPLEEIKPDGERERERHREEKEKQRRRRVRRYLCLTDEHRGRKKIIVDRKAEKNQCSKKNGMTDKNSSFKRE